MGERRHDGVEVCTQGGDEHRQQAVPQRGCEGERDQGARRGQSRDARERWDHGAPDGKQAGNEDAVGPVPLRSEEHTSELQLRSDIVCRLLLEKKKKTNTTDRIREKSPSKSRISQILQSRS